MIISVIFEVKTMSLETGKKLGYIASVINIIVPIISWILVIFMFNQLFQFIGFMLNNPNATGMPPIESIGALSVISSTISSITGAL